MANLSRIQWEGGEYDDSAKDDMSLVPLEHDRDDHIPTTTTHNSWTNAWNTNYPHPGRGGKGGWSSQKGGGKKKRSPKKNPGHQSSK